MRNPQKPSGDKVGNKGLGFKSVFTCTDSPHVVSGEWSFKWDVTGLGQSKDEMSYITPIWLEDSEIPPLFKAEF